MVLAKVFFLFILFANLSVISAQEIPQSSNPNLPQSANPIDNISLEITKISKSLTTFNKRINTLIEQLLLSKNSPFNEKQQKLLLGFEILNKAEQRVEILQKFQIELAEKESSVKTRLAQIEQDAKPESVDRSVAFLGTTKTEETRENRRRTFEFERNSLQGLLSQIQRNLSQTTGELRQAENLVQSLRQKILPQIELELSNL